jgi:hypothetical protein
MKGIIVKRSLKLIRIENISKLDDNDTKFSKKLKSNQAFQTYFKIRFFKDGVINGDDDDSDDDNDGDDSKRGGRSKSRGKSVTAKP